MAQQTINVGASPNDGTGTPLRTAFQYTNSNFTELYTATGPSGNNIVVPGNATITGDLTVDTSTLKVDSSNNRVGIGTASPAVTLDAVSAAGGIIRIRGGSGTNQGGAFYVSNSAGSGTLAAFGDYANVGGGTPDAAATVFTASAVPLRFDVGATEKMRIASDGICTWSNVGGVAGTAMTLNSTGLGIGAGPTSKLTIGTGSFSAAASGTTGMYTTASGLEMLSDSYFFGSRSGGGLMTLNSSGNVGIGVTPAGTGGCLQLKSGITFPATQVASSDANTLDDYEEGTFTPTVVGTTGAGTGTYTTQLGHYTKVGRIVTCDISLVWTAHTGTGALEIGGLPFSVLTTSGYSASAVIGYIDNIALTAGNIPIAVLWWFNTNKIRLNQTPTGGGAAAGVPMDTAGQINLSITYIVA